MSRNFACIPERTIRSLRMYADVGIPTGDFLRACLANDFMDAACRADQDNGPVLPAIALYIYNEIPSNAWGSREKVDAWIAKHKIDLAAETKKLGMDLMRVAGGQLP